MELTGDVPLEPVSYSIQTSMDKNNMPSILLIFFKKKCLEGILYYSRFQDAKGQRAAFQLAESKDGKAGHATLKIEL